MTTTKADIIEQLEEKGWKITDAQEDFLFAESTSDHWLQVDIDKDGNVTEISAQTLDEEYELTLVLTTNEIPSPDDVGNMDWDLADAERF